MHNFIWFLQKRRIFFGWVMVACGILVMSVTHGVVQNCFSLYIKPVTEALGFTRQGFSVCQTLTNVLYMIIALFSGKIFERFKVLGLMRIACIVLPAAYFCYSFCTQLWMFYAVSVVVGIATSFLTFLPFTLIISNWFEDRRGLAIGICFMGSGLGGMLFNALAGGWIAAFGWTSVFRILAVIQAVVMIPILYFVLRTSPQEVGLQPLGSGPVAASSQGGSAPAYGLTLGQAVRSFRFWALILTALIVGLTSTMLSNTIVPHLSDIGYAATYASGVMSCYMGLLAVCKILLGGMYDRLGMRKSTFISVAAILVGLLGLYFGGFQPMHILVVAGAALGCAVGTVAYPILTQSAFGTRAYATIYGIITAANSLACSVCPIFTNSVYDGTGSYKMALLTSIVLTAAVLGLLFTIRPLRPEEMNCKPNMDNVA
ncbi:MAG: MFS transporter [Candidatus Spyradocola sp.]